MIGCVKPNYMYNISNTYLSVIIELFSMRGKHIDSVLI